MADPANDPFECGHEWVRQDVPVWLAPHVQRVEKCEGCGAIKIEFSR